MTEIGIEIIDIGIKISRESEIVREIEGTVIKIKDAVDETLAPALDQLNVKIDHLLPRWNPAQK